ncbi:MAG: twin-arginine translocase TatA/TatE family subunit [Bacteroidota bacterium]
MLAINIPIAIGLGPWEIALVMLVVLLVFGAKRIPEIARGLGKGIREFKDATSEISKELQVDPPRQQVQPPPQQTYQQPTYAPPPQQQAPQQPAPPAQPPAQQPGTQS